MEKKHYNTAGRTRLAAYLRQIAVEPPKSAEEIYSGLCLFCTANGADAPGRSSVYRMLSSLCDEGEVTKFPAGNGDSAVYQHVGAHKDCDRHFHLHCLSCGDVLHLECKCSDEVAEHLLGTHGFTVDRGRSVLYGICAACGKREG
jgi:Fur family ferric uptake transcriptional regulator